MIIYSSTHMGVTLDDPTLASLNLQDENLRGFFSKSDVSRLLDNNPECVGIRFYNVNPSTDFPALLAVCVLENGADMKGGDAAFSTITHMLGNQINISSHMAIELNRTNAFDAIKSAYSFGVPELEKFSAFFSRTMLENLLNNNSHDGISFYKIIWLTGHSTLIGISSNLGQGTIPIVGVKGTDFTNCISDQPCPGHCVRMDANGDEILASTPMASIPGDLDSHYIPIWE